MSIFMQGAYRVRSHGLHVRSMLDEVRLVSRSLSAAVAVLVVAGCAMPSSEPDAQDFAIKACDIEWTDDDGNVVDPGRGTPVYRGTNDSEYKVETHPLTEIRRLADEWQERAVDAAAASQLDPSWLALSSATSNIAELQTALETAREAGFSGDRFWTQSFYTISDLSRHVAAIGDYEAQCKGLLARL